MALLAVTACGNQPVSTSVSEANQEGGNVAIQNPAKPADAEASVRRYLKYTLKDPDSMKGFEISEPRLGKYYGGMFNGFKKVPSWYVCFGYNAKNSYGGYTGYKSYVAFFEGNAIIQAPNNPSQGVQDGFREFNCY